MEFCSFLNFFYENKNGGGGFGGGGVKISVKGNIRRRSENEGQG